MIKNADNWRRLKSRGKFIYILTLYLTAARQTRLRCSVAIVHTAFKSHFLTVQSVEVLLFPEKIQRNMLLLLRRRQQAVDKWLLE